MPRKRGDNNNREATSGTRQIDGNKNEAAAGITYVRRGGNQSDAQKQQKPAQPEAQKQQKLAQPDAQKQQKPQQPPAPEIFSKTHETVKDITKMRSSVKRVWNQLLPLERLMTEVEFLRLEEGHPVDEELNLVKNQVFKLRKEAEDRRLKMIEDKYSAKADKLQMGEFILTKILNNDPEVRTMWLLGKFSKDPTGNQVILTLRKTEFQEA